MNSNKRKRRGDDGIKVRGFFRVHIVEDGKIVGNSGWLENQVTNDGFKQYLCDALGGTSKQVSRMCLGTGTGPGATDTSLNGELNTATYTRTTVTYAISGSKTARFTATWASSSSHITASVAISQIGLINNTTSAGTILCGKSFAASSAWNTNQDINATYDVTFA